MTIALLIFSCTDEGIDPSLLNSIDQPGGPGNTSLVGDWVLQSLDYNGTSSTTASGITVSADFVGTSANENFNVTFKSPRIKLQDYEASDI